MSRARHCGIDSFGALTTFFELLVQFGEQFDESPNGDKALKIAENLRLPGQIKVQLLTETLHGPAGGRPLSVIAG